jgi:hypothetical protein
MKNTIKPMRYKKLGYSLGDFLVSNDGKIISENCILRTYINHQGYKQICISAGSREKKKVIKVHIAVASTFLGVPQDPTLQVMHKNGDKLDNRVENLAWVTHAEYMENAKKNGAFNDRKKYVRCINTGKVFNSINDACEWCGLAKNSGSLRNVLYGLAYTAGKHPKTGEKLRWEYVKEGKE